jgi:hypothetical protein
VSKNGLFEPFICKNEHFTKTGSGQTWAKTQKRVGVFSSVEIFDALAVYLAFSQQGLTTHTIYMSLRDDGMAMVQADDAALLPCNTTLVPKLEPPAPAPAVLGGGGDGGGGLWWVLRWRGSLGSWRSSTRRC